MSQDDRDQRRLPPSPKRLADFRRRGDVARSRDLVTVATLGAGIGTLAVAAPTIGRTLVDLMQDAMSGASDAALPSRLLKDTLSCIGPAAFGGVVGFFAAALPQLGWPPAWKSLGFDLSKIFGLQGFLRLLSPKAAAGRALVSIAKVLVVGGAAYVAMRAELDGLLMPSVETGVVLGATLGRAVMRVVVYAGLALFALAAFDLWWQRREHMARLRMTPEEAKREHKEQEGSPEIKRKRRQKMRQLAKNRHEVAVRTADVVVVNPTHYAVALRYQPGDRSPRVVAKGVDLVAQRIRKIARKFGVPVVPEPPLARALHKLVPEGSEIPRELYHAVAEVLAYIYKIRPRRTSP